MRNPPCVRENAVEATYLMRNLLQGDLVGSWPPYADDQGRQQHRSADKQKDRQNAVGKKSANDQGRKDRTNAAPAISKAHTGRSRTCREEFRLIGMENRSKPGAENCQKGADDNDCNSVLRKREDHARSCHE